MNRMGCWRIAVLPLCTSVLLVLGPTTSALAARPPSLAKVKEIVEKHLGHRRDYAPGDLISRKDVEPIFDELVSLGVVLADNDEELYDDFIPDSAYLVGLLRTERGTAFMRQVRALPGAYDRLERLSWTSAGKDILSDLVDKPDGAVLFKVMLTPAGLKATEKHLSTDPRAQNYLLPTGHIYTASQLLKRLEKTLARQKGAK